MTSSAPGQPWQMSQSPGPLLWALVPVLTPIPYLLDSVASSSATCTLMSHLDPY